jgi:hypothetical protein
MYKALRDMILHLSDNNIFVAGEVFHLTLQMMIKIFNNSFLRTYKGKKKDKVILVTGREVP